MRSEQQHFSYYTGSRWISFSVAALLIALVSIWLAASLKDTEERTERFLVELSVRRMHMGMQLAIGDAMMHGREQEIATWAGSNPVRWLDGELRGYVGSCSRREELGTGSWCFDELRGELHYRPRASRRVQFKNPKDGPLIRWRVVAKNTTAPGGLVGLSVENVTPYEWFAE